MVVFFCLPKRAQVLQSIFMGDPTVHTHTHTRIHIHAFFSLLHANNKTTPKFMTLLSPHTHTHTHTHTQAYTRANLLTFSCYMKTTKPPQYILHIYLLVEVSQNSDCSRIVNRPRIIWAHFK